MVHRNLIKIDRLKKSDKTTQVSVFTSRPTAGLICNDILTGLARQALAFHTTPVRDLITRSGRAAKQKHSFPASECNLALIMGDSSGNEAGRNKI